MKSSTISGWAEITRAAKPLSTYFRAHTTTPFPRVRNRNPAVRVLKNCFRVILRLIPEIRLMRKMMMPADKNLMEASINGESSATAILLNK